MLRWTVIRPAPDTTLCVAASDSGIRGIWFASEIEEPWPRDDSDPLLLRAASQLSEYFGGFRREFDLPLDLQGTPFQLRVWRALLTIPFGQTVSYAQLATQVGNPKAFRAAGAANGKNPIPIVVPCHRVIQTGGGLGGFSCGIAYKRRLLDLEQSPYNEAMVERNRSLPLGF